MMLPDAKTGAYPAKYAPPAPPPPPRHPTTNIGE